MNERRLRDVTASAMTLLSLLATIFMAVVRGNDTALGALIAILAAATGWYLRGRVEASSS